MDGCCAAGERYADEDKSGAAEQAGCEGLGEGCDAEGDRDEGDEVGDDGGAGGSVVADECVVDDVGEAGAENTEDGECDPGTRDEVRYCSGIGAANGT